MDKDEVYYERSLEKIWNKITSQEEEIKRLKEENEELKVKLEKENKHLKGRIIKLENTLE